MASAKDVTRVMQGVAIWNAWRTKYPTRVADLTGAKLHGAYLGGADLRGTKLRGAQLSGANLEGAHLSDIDLGRADLSRAILIRARIESTCLAEADLSGAYLDEANLCGSDLRFANVTAAALVNTDISKAKLHETVLANIDLGRTKGLDTCEHMGPSIIDHRTLQRSGRLPLTFLRGCGLADKVIDYLPSLLGDPIQFYSCFISYSAKDDQFAKRLHADLQNMGVRCWFAPHDLPIGAKTYDAIDAEIRVRDKLLLILSKNAIASNWVEDEVTKAFAEECRRRQTVLFPIRIDDTVIKTTEPWAVKLRDQRNIGDFRSWKDHDAYQEAFYRVLRDLKAASRLK